MTVKTHCLQNGFRIVTEDMPGLKSASIGIWIKAGGRHERVEQNGIAHFLEHMAFKGTKRRSSLQIAETIEDVGGYINAYTSREMTAYYARILCDDVNLALDVISDIVLNPIFNPTDIEVERGVILSEIGQALDTPDDIIFDWLQEVSYPDQPLGRSILGPAERVSNFKKQDLSRFVKENYSPDNMILAAAGSVNHESLVRQCEEIFGKLVKRKQKQLLVGEFAGGEVRHVKELEQAHFALAFESPNYTNPDIYTAQVFATAFGGGMSSRLFQEVREKRGLCYSIFANVGSYSDTGTLTLYAGTSADKVLELANVTVDEIKRAADNMKEVEIARARTQMKAGLLMGLESPSVRAERLARMLAVWDRIPSLDETIEKIDAVNVHSVCNFVAAMVSGSPAALALYGPVMAAPSIDDLQARLVA